jgi:hypothetical protein
MAKKAIIRVGVENNMDGHSLAWALDYMGCFANGTDGKEALLKIPLAMRDFRNWMLKHDNDSWLRDLKGVEVQQEEAFECYFIDKDYHPAKDGYEVDAWFQDDWRPLTKLVIERGLKILAWSREDLLKLVSPLSPEILDRTHPKERWSIRGILGHIGGAEHWYMQRLDRAGMNGWDLPKDEFMKLKVVRGKLNEILPALEGVEQVLGREGEFWSPRKMLRRAIWHELDHIKHIQKLIVL